MKLVINPRYAHLEGFVRGLHRNFESMPYERVLRNIRNDVREVSVADEHLVVKSFRHLSLVNRAVYGRLRSSKSMRAFSHAERLALLGIGTPEPVAAVDFWERGLLAGSYFVSAYSDYRSMEEFRDSEVETIKPLLDALTEFLIRLHDRGVVHHDLNISNILYRELWPGEYDFQLIDINRMDFKRPLTSRERLANMSKFECSPDAYFYILGRYADLKSRDSDLFKLQGMVQRLMEIERRRVKDNYKRVLRNK